MAALVAAALVGCVAGGSGDEAGTQEACGLVPDPGDCDAAFERYYYDPAARRCAPFTWGGCDGVVPFNALTECQGACEPCEAFFATTTPQPTHAPVAISLRNDSAAPIYLRAYTPGGGAVGFRAQTFALRPLGAEEPLITAPNDCDFPCALFDNEDCGNACSDAGPPPGPIVIQPGATYTGAWSGQQFADVAVPDRCLPESCPSGLQCGRWLNAASGEYTVTAAVATAWNCLNVPCTCTPNAEGWCQIDAVEGQNGPVDTVELSGSLTLPGGPLALVYP